MKEACTVTQDTVCEPPQPPTETPPTPPTETPPSDTSSSGLGMYVYDNNQPYKTWTALAFHFLMI